MKRLLPIFLSGDSRLVKQTNQHQSRTGKPVWLCFLLILLQQVSWAQTIPAGAPDWAWAKQAGGPAADRANSVTTDKDGNVYTTGTFTGTAAFDDKSLTSGGAEDIFIAKHDATGKLLWVKQAGGTAAEEASKVLTDAAGNVYVAGTFTGTAAFGDKNLTSAGETDVFLVKYNAAGESQWAKKIGGADKDNFKALFIDAAGNIYLAGINDNIYTFEHDINITKYNMTGDVSWSINAGGTGDYSQDIAFNKEGNAYVTGSFSGTMTIGDQTFTSLPHPDGGFYFDVFTAKYNADGQVVWAHQGQSMEKYVEDDMPGGGFGEQITTDAEGNVYISGTFLLGSIRFGDIVLDVGFPDSGIGVSAFVAKYDKAGNVEWAKGVETTIYDLFLVDLITDSADNLYLAYNYRGSLGHFLHVKALKFNPAGNIIGQIEERADEIEEYEDALPAHSIAVDAANRLYITFSFFGTADIKGTGTYEDSTPITSDNFNNIFTAIYDADGKPLWVDQVEIRDVTTKADAPIYVVGSFEGTRTLGNITLTSNGSTDAFIAKLNNGTEAPVLATFSPRQGLPGRLVTIRGSGFSSTTSVLFGDKLAGFQVISDNIIKAIVPVDAVRARITVVTAGGQDKSGKSFIVLQPSIRAIAPTAGAVGSTVILVGNHFTSAKEVYFNGVKAEELKVYYRFLMTAVVPEGATTGKISLLLTGGGFATSTQDFTVTEAAPAIAVNQELARKVTEEEKAGITQKVVAYPNPFSSDITLSFTLEQAQPVGFTIYSASGQQIRQVKAGELAAGSHQLLWDGKDNQGRTVAEGLYFYQLQINNKLSAGKLLKADSPGR